MKTRCGFIAGALAMTTVLGQAQTQEFNPGVTLPSQAVAKPLKVFVLEKDKADKVKATGMYYRLLLTTDADISPQTIADNPVLAKPIESPEQHAARIAWWREAKFGMFIHWGLYSIPAGVWKDKVHTTGYSEWIMFGEKIRWCRRMRGPHLLPV